MIVWGSKANILFHMLYKFQPFSTTKELGKEYNAHCAIVPSPEDWILILDWDAMILSRNAYRIIEHVTTMQTDVQVFGATTNRIGYEWQRHEGKVSKDDNMLHHMQIAEQLERRWGTTTMQVRTVAGFFLLFKKQYWLENPFQEKIIGPDGKLFDFAFCRAAAKREQIARLMGVYVWHSYRLTTSRADMKHLV